MKTMREEWVDFRDMARIPRGGTQEHEMMRAFYSGAFCFLDVVMHNLSDEHGDPTPEDMLQMTSLHEEIMNQLKWFVTEDSIRYPNRG